MRQGDGCRCLKLDVTLADRTKRQVGKVKLLTRRFCIRAVAHRPSSIQPVTVKLITVKLEAASSAIREYIAFSSTRGCA